MDSNTTPSTALALEFHHDPGHGWLRLTPADLIVLGLHSDDFTRFSFRGPDGAVYAEEDCDIGAVQAAADAQNIKVDSHEVWHKGNAPCRSYASAGALSPLVPLYRCQRNPHERTYAVFQMDPRGVATTVARDLDRFEARIAARRAARNIGRPVQVFRCADTHEHVEEVRP